MVSESDIELCANEEVGPSRGWIRSHIGWRGEESIPFKCVETSPYQTRFEAVRLMTRHNGSDAF